MIADVLYLRLIPDQAPIVFTGKPRFSKVKELLALSDKGHLLIVTHLETPYLSNEYRIHPGFNDDLALFSQHYGPLLP